MDKEKREYLIENSYFCFNYKQFLIQNPDEPCHGMKNWKNNVNYMSWIHKKHIDFRKQNGYPSDFHAGDEEYNKSFQKWLIDSK